MSWLVGRLVAARLTHPPKPSKSPYPVSSPTPNPTPTTPQHQQEESLAAVHLADSAGLAISIFVGVLLVAFRRVSPNRRQEWFGVRTYLSCIHTLYYCVYLLSPWASGVVRGAWASIYVSLQRHTPNPLPP